MTQIFIFGSSNAYGAGGPNGGWADMLKLHYHHKMYANEGLGEKLEIFNFAKSGALIQFVQTTFPEQVKHYGKAGRKIAIVSIGSNNSRADGTPENFVSSIEEYTDLMTDLLQDLQSHFDQVIAVDYRPYNEAKTTPKINPFTGNNSYFWNDRTGKFNTALKNICSILGIKVSIPDIQADDWIENHLSADGLHPNDAGYRLMFEAIEKEIQL